MQVIEDQLEGCRSGELSCEGGEHDALYPGRTGGELVKQFSVDRAELVERAREGSEQHDRVVVATVEVDPGDGSLTPHAPLRGKDRLAVPGRGTDQRRAVCPPRPRVGSTAVRARPHHHAEGAAEASTRGSTRRSIRREAQRRQRSTRGHHTETRVGLIERRRRSLFDVRREARAVRVHERCRAWHGEHGRGSGTPRGTIAAPMPAATAHRGFPNPRQHSISTLAHHQC